MKDDQFLGEFLGKKNPLSEIAIVVEEKIIKPVWNKNVFDQAGGHLLAVNKKHPNAKLLNIHHTSFLVYYALAEGAKEQGVDFPYSLVELWALIDIQEYVYVLQAYQQQHGHGLGQLYKS